jgi:hypothetical protein
VADVVKIGDLVTFIGERIGEISLEPPEGGIGTVITEGDPSEGTWVVDFPTGPTAEYHAEDLEVVGASEPPEVHYRDGIPEGPD